MARVAGPVAALLALACGCTEGGAGSKGTTRPSTKPLAAPSQRQPVPVPVPTLHGTPRLTTRQLTSLTFKEGVDPGTYGIPVTTLPDSATTKPGPSN
ncbi:hypothetical protein [Streptomyces sp. NPDC050738]|uniref:hypothetical protein n=1 Tax=Streptomyces sp. NPDC050738 TaxID=3154744 RepID=UPI00342DA66B